MTFPGEQGEFIFYPESVSQWLDGTNGHVEVWNRLGEVMDAIFSARASIGLEQEAAASIELGYESEGCSTATVEAFNIYENQLVDSLTDGIKLDNQEEFLTDVIDWLSQDLPVAKTWSFLPNDGPTCRASFIEIEQFLDENVEGYVGD